MKAALVFLAAAAPLLLLSAFVRHPLAELLSLGLAAAFPVAIMALGASREGRLGPLRAPLALLLVLVVGGLTAVFALRGQVAEGPWLLGLPIATAIQLYGIGVLPLPLVCLAYALSFDRHGLRKEQLEELGRRFERHRPPEA